MWHRGLKHLEVGECEEDMNQLAVNVGENGKGFRLSTSLHMQGWFVQVSLIVVCVLKFSYVME